MPATSLRTALFLWLLGPLIGLWLVGSLAVIVIVRHITQTHYDEELLDIAQSINVFVRAEADGLTMTISDVEQRALLFDSMDEEVFAVTDDKGALIAGSADLPRPSSSAHGAAPFYFDAPYGGRSMRWITLSAQHGRVGPDGGERRAHITVGETRRKRAIATREAILYVVAPQLALAGLLAVAVWYGIGRGLRPMWDLRRRLRERKVTDLEQIAIEGAPEEIGAVVDELNRLLGRLGGSLKQQSAFIGDAAHQLRTPLAALKASVEYVQRHREAGDRRAALDRVIETTDRCIRVVNQLLALAQADVAQTGGVALQEVDVVSLCEETVAASVAAALAGGIDLGFEAIAPRCTILAEPTLLREALRNLIDNAIRYTPAGGHVTVSVVTREETVRVSVTDDGPGVPAADRTRVFERFQRGDAASGTGSGLGLPIARLCARAMGGDVTHFDPPNGNGAGFAIELPLAAGS
jgi:two-component system sensor histidine kinase TctE